MRTADAAPSASTFHVGENPVKSPNFQVETEISSLQIIPYILAQNQPVLKLNSLKWTPQWTHMKRKKYN